MLFKSKQTVNITRSVWRCPVVFKDGSTGFLVCKDVYSLNEETFKMQLIETAAKAFQEVINHKRPCGWFETNLFNGPVNLLEVASFGKAETSREETVFQVTIHKFLGILAFKASWVSPEFGENGIL